MTLHKRVLAGPQLRPPLPEAAAPWTALSFWVWNYRSSGLLWTNPSGTYLPVLEPSNSFHPPLGQVSNLSAFSISFPSHSPFLPAESSGALVSFCWNEHFLCLPTLLFSLPYNIGKSTTSCSWMYLLGWGRKAGTQWLCSIVWLLCLGWELGEAFTSSLVVCPVSWQPKATVFPYNPLLMEIPASILLPLAGLAHSQSAQIEEGWRYGRSQLLEEVQREKS